jgi:hypothetical protein
VAQNSSVSPLPLKKLVPNNCSKIGQNGSLFRGRAISAKKRSSQPAF